MANGLSRLVAEVQAVAAGLRAQVVTDQEHRDRVAQLEAQAIAWELGRAQAEHLEGCILPRPDEPTCEPIRERYGLCPDHDGWCAPGCPVTGGGWPQTYQGLRIEQRWTGWWAECSECAWTAGPCDTQTEADAHARQHLLAVREVRPDER